MANEIVLTKEEIQEAVQSIADKLNAKYKKQTSIPIFIGVLKGAMPFFQDLVKKCKFDMKLDYIQVSSYSGTSTTGVIHLLKDVSEDINGKEVFIVEDIIDTGLTLSYLKQYLKVKFNPKSITLISLIDKKPLRKVDLDVDYAGVSMVENKFLCGYGLDYKEMARNTDYIFVPTKKQLAQWDKLLEDKKD